MSTLIDLLLYLQAECWVGGHRKLDRLAGDFRWCPRCHRYRRCT